MPLDPQMKTILDGMANANMAPIEEQDVEYARHVLDGLAALVGPGPEVGSVEDRNIDGPGGPLPVRIYRPDIEGTLPAIVWFHGGGWVIGSIEHHDTVCRQMANGVGAVVISVEYRLAPEHRFPAATDDCLAATRWVHDHAAELGISPDRLAVGGDSAGGNLAAVTALRARDEGGPTIKFQLLVYPVTDAAMDTPSYSENSSGYMLTAGGMAWFWDHYLGPDGDPAHPHASPLRAEDLTGLPPALVLTAEFDPLRDEGEDYAARLGKAGVDTTLIRYDGLIHGFFSQGRLFDATQAVVDETCKALHVALG